MMGLCFQTSRWLDHLWAEHVGLSTCARSLIQQGISKQGPAFAGFPADLHATLYLPSEPPRQPRAPAWASRLHNLSSELAEWAQLRLMCAKNGFAAAIAAERVLEHLLPHVPDAPQASASQPEAAAEHPPQGQGRLGTGPPQPGDDSPRASLPPSPHQPSPPPSAPDDDASLRATLRRAARDAKNAINNAEAPLEGLSTPLHLAGPGTLALPAQSGAKLAEVRRAHARLQESERLRAVCTLAGRLERLAAGKRRSRIRPGVGEVHGIGHGDDLSRLLPSELVRLRHPQLRRLLLARLVRGQALSYAMEGHEPQGRGPIVVLLDESGSLRVQGRDVLSKAAALALLSTATRQRRSFHLVGFNGDIVRELSVAHGKANFTELAAALDVRCYGGTDLEKPIFRAIDLIRTAPLMKQADVVIISDGEVELSKKAIYSARKLTRREGVSWFVVGVGSGADVTLQSLGPIATQMVRIKNPKTEGEAVVPVINLEREP